MALWGGSEQEVNEKGPAGGSLCLALLPALAGTRDCSVGHRAAAGGCMGGSSIATGPAKEMAHDLEIKQNILCL